MTDLLTLQDTDETLHVLPHVVNDETRWCMAAAAIKAWSDDTPAQQLIERYADLLEMLDPDQLQQLSQRFGLQFLAEPLDILQAFIQWQGPRRPELMRAAVLWAQQEARTPSGVEHLLDQVIPSISEQRLQQLYSEMMGLYLTHWLGSSN